MRYHAGLLTILLAACDDRGDGSAELTRETVTNIPNGTATGDEFTGLYSSEGEATGRCTCTSSACSDVQQEEYLPSGVWYITQTAGHLEGNLRGSINTQCSGGIDADGSFSCGVARSENVLTLIHGQASGDGDTRKLEVEVTTRFTPIGHPEETCTGRASGTFRP